MINKNKYLLFIAFAYYVIHVRTSLEAYLEKRRAGYVLLILYYGLQILKVWQDNVFF